MITQHPNPVPKSHQRRRSPPTRSLPHSVQLLHNFIKTIALALASPPWWRRIRFSQDFRLRDHPTRPSPMVIKGPSLRHLWSWLNTVRKVGRLFKTETPSITFYNSFFCSGNCKDSFHFMGLSMNCQQQSMLTTERSLALCSKVSQFFRFTINPFLSPPLSCYSFVVYLLSLNN